MHNYSHLLVSKMFEPLHIGVLSAEIHVTMDSVSRQIWWATKAINWLQTVLSSKTSCKCCLEACLHEAKRLCTQ